MNPVSAKLYAGQRYRDGSVENGKQEHARPGVLLQLEDKRQ
jgi:hypothetical protein